MKKFVFFVGLLMFAVLTPGLSKADSFGSFPPSSFYGAAFGSPAPSGVVQSFSSPGLSPLDSNADVMGSLYAASNVQVSDLDAAGSLAVNASDLANEAARLALAKARPDAKGCPTSAPQGSLRGSASNMGVFELCARSVEAASSPQAAKAIKYVFSKLGVPYACGGVGRDSDSFDCSSLVSRAYQHAGLKTRVDGWSPTTHLMIPDKGLSMVPWLNRVQDAKPGDLALYVMNTGASQHVAMVLSDGLMVHTSRCGDVVNVTDFWSTSPSFASFVGFRTAS